VSNDYYALRLGELWSNFLSLDVCLRTFHVRLPGSAPTGIPYAVDVYSFPVGTEFSESAVADMKFFSSLVVSYNETVVARGLGSPIDAALIELRNALAHGFVSTDRNEGPMRIIKFGRSRPGFVKITMNETMDLAWFKSQMKRVYDAIQAVHAAAENLPRC
jgi:hypothetical protein